MLRWSHPISVLGVFSVLLLASAPLLAAEEYPDEYDGEYDSEDEEAGDDEADDDDKADDDEADDDEADDDEADDDEADDDAKKKRRDNTDSSDPSEIDADDALDKNASTYEKPGKTYRFLGARYRGIIVPEFMMDLFGDGGRTVYVNGVGPEFGIRKDNFEYIFALWWAGYYMKPTPFKASDDPRIAWEIVESKINVIYATADFLWGYPIANEFAINWGMAAGLGVVFGDLIREQAYPRTPADYDDPYEYVPCNGLYDPNTASAFGGRQFCDDDNDHYDGYTEPSWANGGSKPIVFPWFAIQTGFRIKPHRNVAIRGDLGFGLTGPFFGVAAAYGF